MECASDFAAEVLRACNRAFDRAWETSPISDGYHFDEFHDHDLRGHALNETNTDHQFFSEWRRLAAVEFDQMVPEIKFSRLEIERDENLLLLNFSSEADAMLSATQAPGATTESAGPQTQKRRPGRPRVNEAESAKDRQVFEAHLSGRFPNLAALAVEFEMSDHNGRLNNPADYDAVRRAAVQRIKRRIWREKKRRKIENN